MENLVKRPLPSLTTATIDQTRYDEQRGYFLTRYIEFNEGMFNSGSLALNYLTIMFHVLPATRYFSMHEDKAIEFLESIRRLKRRMEQYKEDNNTIDFSHKTQIPEEFTKDLESIYRQFHKIMFECGYSK